MLLLRLLLQLCEGTTDLRQRHALTATHTCLPAHSAKTKQHYCAERVPSICVLPAGQQQQQSRLPMQKHTEPIRLPTDPQCVAHRHQTMQHSRPHQAPVRHTHQRQRAAHTEEREGGEGGKHARLQCDSGICTLLTRTPPCTLSQCMLSQTPPCPTPCQRRGSAS